MERTGRRFPCHPRRRRRRQEVPSQPEIVRSATRRLIRPPSPQQTPSPMRRQRSQHPSSPTPFRSRFQRYPPAGARKPYFIFGDAQNSVDLWFFDLARSEPVQFLGRGSADVAPTTSGNLRCRELRRGRMVGHLQAAPSRRLGRPVCARTVHAGCLLGLGRVLARAWQQAGLTVWYSLYVEPEVVTSAVGPMIRTGSSSWPSS